MNSDQGFIADRVVKSGTLLGQFVVKTDNSQRNLTTEK